MFHSESHRNDLARSAFWPKTTAILRLQTLSAACATLAACSGSPPTPTSTPTSGAESAPKVPRLEAPISTKPEARSGLRARSQGETRVLRVGLQRMEADPLRPPGRDRRESRRRNASAHRLAWPRPGNARRGLARPARVQPLRQTDALGRLRRRAARQRRDQVNIGARVCTCTVLAGQYWRSAAS